MEQELQKEQKCSFYALEQLRQTAEAILRGSQRLLKCRAGVEKYRTAQPQRAYYHYFSSENMTAYIRLCRQYESLLHMKPEENPFWREASTCIKNALWLDSYCYDWALKEKTGKKFSSGIVFAYDDEFCDYVQLIDGLLDIFTFFDQRLCGLEKAVEAAQRNARCTERRAA